MRITHPLLSTLLLLTALTAPSAAHASSGAVVWSPPTLVRGSPAPTTPPAAPAAPAAPAVDKAPAIEYEAEPPMGPPTPPRRRVPKSACKANKARCHAQRPPQVDPRLIEANTQRTRLLALAATGRPAEAAQMLGGAAAANADPILYLAAAQAELRDPQVKGEPLVRALHLTQEAQRLITTPTDLRIPAAEGPALTVEAEALVSYVKGRQAQLRHQQRGKAELACGATFLALGATGLALLVSGAALSSRASAALGAYDGEDAAYVAALQSSKQRAGNLLTAGAISGLFGAALGIPLTIMGAGDLKRARSGPERPSFRLTPGFAGVSLSGRF